MVVAGPSENFSAVTLSTSVIDSSSTGSSGSKYIEGSVVDFF